MGPRLIIHLSAAVSAGVGAGLAQLPGSDAPVLVAIQTAMILGLADHYRVSLHRVAIVELALTMAATMIGRGLSQLLLGWVPALGNALNALTALTITEGLGWLCTRWFARAQDL